ncbi:hypothetical protein [Helicobacter cynogastricus]|uniref:hypothetical protein n=1 Tax=Helicobacter cynogastricus TaxID=329937 RepID=UPI000CF170BC|nr:hypothetical protein [Helicobacter cynogastricus]
MLKGLYIGFFTLIFFEACTHGIFTPPSLDLKYESTTPKVPPKGYVALQPPNLTFFKDFVPHYYQKHYTDALQKGVGLLLAHFGYPSATDAPSARLQGTIRLAFEKTPKTLKETQALLKATDNNGIDPVRVLRLLSATSTLKFECAQSHTPFCGLEIHARVQQPILRANRLDSDPNDRRSDLQIYNDALVQALNKLYQKSLQALESQLKSSPKTGHAL